MRITFSLHNWFIGLHWGYYDLHSFEGHFKIFNVHFYLGPLSLEIKIRRKSND